MPDTRPPTNGRSHATLIVWDGESVPSATDGQILVWRSYVGSGAIETISISQLVEENSDRLRTDYLSWIQDLAESGPDGRSTIELLQIRPGISYWWMTLFSEKCNYSKSPQIEDAIRLMALENWMKTKSFGRVVLVTANVRLAECLGSWCEASHLTFEWIRQKSSQGRQWSPRRVFRSLPYPVQALTWLCLYLFRRWPLRGVGLPEWRLTKCRTTFVSYLFNLVPKAAKEGRFESNYWGDLPEVLERDGCFTNWLHLYLDDELVPNAGAAAKLIRKFNARGGGLQTHATLDTFLGPGVVYRALRDWVRLQVVARRVRRHVHFPRDGGLDFWPLFRNDWSRSFSGSDAIANLLYFNLLEAAFGQLPRQAQGVYLQENQAWEAALVAAWKAAGHGRIIGAPHSTIRFWDLRYFFDRRCYQHAGPGRMPLPDLVALNGAAARDQYLKGGCPQELLVEVEALRYLYLVQDGGGRKLAGPEIPARLRVLVLGEYLALNTERQMRLLEEAASYLPKNVKFIVKPHPACPVRAADYPGLELEITNERISHLLGSCDVAYTNNATSAAVDACCAGVPVVSMLDPESFNLSPLRGREGVQFVSTPGELARALIAATSDVRAAVQPTEFFALDPSLSRWRKLLSGVT